MFNDDDTGVDDCIDADGVKMITIIVEFMVLTMMMMLMMIICLYIFATYCHTYCVGLSLRKTGIKFTI